ncbi:hypothetical protein KCV07_g3772, partial [Aureobasidium melanogenum]
MERRRQEEAAARDESIQRSRNKLIHRMSVWYRPSSALLALAVYYFANLMLLNCVTLEDFFRFKIDTHEALQTCFCAVTAFVIPNIIESWMLYDKVSPTDEARKLLKLIALERLLMLPLPKSTHVSKISTKIKLFLIRTLLLKPFIALIATTIYHLTGLILTRQMALENLVLVSVDFVSLTMAQSSSLSPSPLGLLRIGFRFLKLMTTLDYWAIVQTVVSVLFASLMALRLETSILDQIVKPTKLTLRNDGVLKQRIEG